MTIALAEWRPYHHHRPHNTVVGSLLVLPQLHSPQLGNHREVLVHLPPSYHADTQRRYPVLYLHDGQNLFDAGTGFAGQEWRVDETLTMLSAEGVECIAVGLPHMGEHRIREYTPFKGVAHGRGEDYLQFLVETVKPLIDRDFRTLPDRMNTGLLGSSMGGLISLYGFFHCPETFGLAGVMSPSLWLGRGAIYPYVQNAPFSPGKIYLDNGTREPSARRMYAQLLKKGYRPRTEVKYVREPNAEHTESAWARRLPDALRFLFPAQTLFQKNSHCSYCGTAFTAPAWPRACAQCGNVSYLNPLPVSVVVLPVGQGVLTVRRNIEPRRGQLALPGGFINAGESWQAAGAREVLEETGLTIDPAQLKLFDTLSAPDGTVLIFGLAAPYPAPLPPLALNEEVAEFVVVTQPVELAFPLHTQVLRAYLANGTGAHHAH